MVKQEPKSSFACLPDGQGKRTCQLNDQFFLHRYDGARKCWASVSSFRKVVPSENSTIQDQPQKALSLRGAFM